MDTVDILLRRAASMVADTVKAHDTAIGIFDLTGAPSDMLFDLIGPGTVFKGKPKCVHRRTIGRLPDKVFPCNPLFVTAGTHE